ncbi:hypothetical protein IWQ60_006616 [Tieghemiomyces parasiticus]|uniref:Uncharacterized protein n=1 Tax=Tieghemiomyces parasiticus TaxID=78921 RepID=A0A9W8DTB9_9FUNG|nr:hypothetical protein IWQ60_006616 [Tieghemiomyces parasiticus]
MDDQIGEPQFNMVEDRTPPPPTRPLPAPPLTSKKSTLPSSDSEKPELTPRQYQPISSLPPHQTAGSDGILASRQSDKETWKLTRNGEQKHVAVPAKSGPGTSGSYPIPLFERLSHSNQPEPPHTPASPRVLRGTNPSIDLPNHMDVVNQVGPVDANAGRDSDRAINAGLGDLQVHLNEARTLTAMELVLELATLRQLLTQDTPQDRTYRAREWALRWTLQNSLRVLDPMVTISEPDQKNVDGPGIHSSQV